MDFIEILPLNNGSHRNFSTDKQIEVPDGYAIVPENLTRPYTFPFIKDIVVEYNKVIDWKQDEESYNLQKNKELLQKINKKIIESKDQLFIYLQNNPLQWKDGNFYSITQEKQNQLTSKIMAATMAQTLGQEYQLTWNSTGEVCTTWELSELSSLAFAIDERVTKLVTYQQEKEIEIKKCQTQEELNSINIDYDSVK